MARSGSASGADAKPRATPAPAPGAPRIGELVDVTVEALGGDARGRGVFDRDGHTRVELAGVLGGERVRAKVDHVDRRGLVYASLASVTTPSPDRVDAPCPRFLACGGCDLLHAPLAVQHALKRRLVADALGVELDRVDPVVASPRTFGYRALAKLVVGPGNVLGSYKPRSHDVADMAGCVVHAVEAEVVVDALREHLAARPVTGLRYVLVRASMAERQNVVLFVVRSERSGIEALAEVIAERDDVASVSMQVNDSPGDELLTTAPIVELVKKRELFERIGRVSHRLRAGAFAQVNPLAAAELYARAIELGQVEGRVVLDLYSGSGGLALTAASRGARCVVAVEPVRSSIEAARESAEGSALGEGVLFLEDDAEGALDGLVREAQKTPGARPFDVVVLNPPRKGASAAVVDGIAALGPERIVYVSCGPDTLARDLERLATHGWRAERIVPVDLFPMTRHVETIVLATRA